MSDSNSNTACAEETSRLLQNSGMFRDCSLARNGELYTKGDEYNRESSYIKNQDGDGRGRDPQDPANINDAGTQKDFDMRACLTAKDKYYCGNEYGVGSGNV